MVRAALCSIVLTLGVAHLLRAQSEEVPFSDRDLADQHLPNEGYSPVLVAPSGENFIPPQPECGDPLGEPPPCDSSYHRASVRVGVEFDPTTSQIHGNGYSFWTEESVPASRIEIG